MLPPLLEPKVQKTPAPFGMTLLPFKGSARHRYLPETSHNMWTTFRGQDHMYNVFNDRFPMKGATTGTAK